MKGLDALAKICEPEPVKPEPQAINATFSNEQCDMIARRVIELLQNGTDAKDSKPADPTPAEDETPDTLDDPGEGGNDDA